MKKETLDAVASSLETEPGFYPYLAELLHDMWALGSSPHLIVDLIRPLKLPAEKTTVLDLGCGKGAVAITLAHEFAFKATGIDASRDFLKSAREKADKYHVSGLCTFIQQDIFDYLQTSHAFDLVVLASLGSLLGNFKETVGKLRETVKSGGHIIIDDGYLKGTKRIKRRGYMHYRPHQEVLRQLTAHGDTLIKEMPADAESKKINDRYLTNLQDRKPSFIKKYPHLKRALNHYIQSQKTDCEIIEQSLHSAIWLIRKN